MLKEESRKLTEQIARSAGLEPFRASRERAPVADVHGAVQARLDAELKTYPHKEMKIILLLWLFTGVFGGHRFYLERPGTGILMFVTGGGSMIWWIIDLFLLKGMIQEFNEEQDRRQLAGLPAVGWEFIPSVDVDLSVIPPWYKDKRGVVKALGKGIIVADAVVLAVFSMVLGDFMFSRGAFQPAMAALINMILILFSDRLMPYFHWPVVHEIIHLDYKLRLFYYFNKPGGALKLLLRPIFGLFRAPFDRKVRAEIKIYLEISTVFAAFFLVLDLIVKLFSGGFSFDNLLDNVFNRLIRDLVIIYVLVSPICATLTKHVLLRRSRIVLWLLCGISLVFMVI